MDQSHDNAVFADSDGFCVIPSPPDGCEPGPVYGFPPPPVPRNDLYGRVVTNRGGTLVGIEGAKIKLNESSLAISAVTTTDTNGNFSFVNYITSVNYSLKIEKQSYETLEFDDVYICKDSMPATILPDCQIAYQFPWSLYLPSITLKKNSEN